MTLLILGLVLFIGVHVFSVFRDQRQAVITKIGENPYKGIYALVSFAGIGLMVIGMRGVEPVYLWAAPRLGPQGDRRTDDYQLYFDNRIHTADQYQTPDPPPNVVGRDPLGRCPLT